MSEAERYLSLGLDALGILDVVMEQAADAGMSLGKYLQTHFSHSEDESMPVLERPVFATPEERMKYNAQLIKQCYLDPSSTETMHRVMMDSLRGGFYHGFD